MNVETAPLPAPPRPEPGPETAPYWDGLRAHELRVQRCTQCQTLRHYPRPLCSQCYSFEHDWQTLSGNGRLLSWTVCHHPFHPGFKQRVPYTMVTVDMAEGVRMQAPLHAPLDTPLAAGLALRLAFDDVDDTLTLPCFEITG